MPVFFSMVCDQQLRAAVRVGRVDLGRAVAGDLDQRVARDRHQQVRARAGVQQHDRVGALPGRVAGAELLALARRRGRRGSRCRPGGTSCPAGRRDARRWASPRPCSTLFQAIRRHHDQEHQPQQQEQEHVAEPEAEPAALPLSRRRGQWRRRRSGRPLGGLAFLVGLQLLAPLAAADGRLRLRWRLDRHDLGVLGGLGGGLDGRLGSGRRAAAGRGCGGSWPKRWLRSWAASFAWVSSGRRCLGTGRVASSGARCLPLPPPRAPPAPYSHSNSGVPVLGCAVARGRSGGTRHGGEPTR